MASLPREQLEAMCKQHGVDITGTDKELEHRLTAAWKDSFAATRTTSEPKKETMVTPEVTPLVRKSGRKVTPGTETFEHKQDMQQFMATNRPFVAKFCDKEDASVVARERLHSMWNVATGADDDDQEPPKRVTEVARGALFSTPLKFTAAAARTAGITFCYRDEKANEFVYMNCLLADTPMLSNKRKVNADTESEKTAKAIDKKVPKVAVEKKNATGKLADGPEKPVKGVPTTTVGNVIDKKEANGKFHFVVSCTHCNAQKKCKTPVTAKSVNLTTTCASCNASLIFAC